MMNRRNRLRRAALLLALLLLAAIITGVAASATTTVIPKQLSGTWGLGGATYALMVVSPTGRVEINKLGLGLGLADLPFGPGLRHVLARHGAPVDDQLRRGADRLQGTAVLPDGDIPLEVHEHPGRERPPQAHED